MSHPQYKDIGSPVTRMIEECSELTQALCKADRFGWFNFHPDHPNDTNLDDVRREMDDVLEAMNKLDIHLRELMFERFKDANTKTPNATVSSPPLKADKRSEDL